MATAVAIDWKRLGVTEPDADKGMHRDVYLCQKCKRTDSPLLFAHEDLGQTINCNLCHGKDTMQKVDAERIPHLIHLIESGQIQQVVA